VKVELSLYLINNYIMRSLNIHHGNQIITVPCPTKKETEGTVQVASEQILAEFLICG
jgi:hypothetical protein